ncbi:cobalamin-dependent protein [Ciceribacter sp. L1K23]|uniref:MerR family transcriptional regulator n=1 Tax=Ciceribacter sp. L1K23 TaxID=2820276 RepID=UPI001B83F6C0|nr:cobalamin-dependent protein [Ciceribacter sp. L1K23]MBR0556623.1 cobalamin-dependent protein [Ciceribacter sp. L1K23]
MADAQAGRGEALLTLADVLRISGITKLVLHAWERRYGFAPAGRSETGRRFYTREQAEQLRLLKACSDAGYRIGTLINLPIEELIRIEENHRARLSLVSVLEHIQTLDGEKLRDALQQRADKEGSEGFVRHTAIPLLHEVGLLWANGAVTVAAEHLATSAVKRVLGTMLDSCPPASAGAQCLIATTLEGEQHEVGALVVALMARLAGWDALYLGPDLPVSEIASAARQRHADVVCLSGLAGKKRLVEMRLRDLRGVLPEKTAIWLGGPAFAEMPSMPAVRFFENLDICVDMLHSTPAIRSHTA